MPWLNKLYFGDCFTITREHLRNASVDLIYLDPPFNSQRQYNSIYKDETGRPLPDQIDAFCDMWELDPETERSIRMAPIMMRDQGIDDATVQLWELWMRALRRTNPRLLAYLAYMSLRLLDFHRVLKPTGSLYLHCDPTASHYVKALLDAVFGDRNFVNEIVWKRSGGKSDAKRYGRTTDRILFYAKDARHRTWNRTYQALDPDYVRRTYTRDDGDGRGPYTTMPLHGPGTRTGESGMPWRGHDPGKIGNHWATPTKGVMHGYIRSHDLIPGWPDAYPSVHERLDALDDADLLTYGRGGIPRLKTYLAASRGIAATDLITDVPMASGNERLGYATQKPLALLKRIIRASTNKGDVVLDPFCGCATTIEAAEALERRWVGIDIAIHAIRRVASVRLTDRCGLVEGEDYTIQGVPSTLEGAQLLHEQDPYQFQRWAVAEVEGFVTSKQTADGGIDGRLYFDVPNEPDLQSMVLEVKGGSHVRITDLRALRAVLDDDLALMAGLIIMEPRSPHQTRNFERYMAQAGVLEVLGREYPRMQMLTVPEILEGKRFDTPTVAGVHIPQPVLPGIQRAEA